MHIMTTCPVKPSPKSKPTVKAQTHKIRCVGDSMFAFTPVCSSRFKVHTLRGKGVPLLHIQRNKPLDVYCDQPLSFTCDVHRLYTSTAGSYTGHSVPVDKPCGNVYKVEFFHIRRTCLCDTYMCCNCRSCEELSMTASISIYGLTCHAHTSDPSESSLIAVKLDSNQSERSEVESNTPAMAATKSPLEYPAITTDPSSAMATSFAQSKRIVPP